MLGLQKEVQDKRRRKMAYPYAEAIRYGIRCAVMMGGIMDLADGRTVPDECVKALDELELRWPGATLKGARGVIVAAVLKTYEELGLEPTRWWRVLDNKGKLWCESSDESECRTAMKPGYTLQHLYDKTVGEWRTQDDGSRTHASSEESCERTS